MTKRVGSDERRRAMYYVSCACGLWSERFELYVRQESLQKQDESDWQVLHSVKCAKCEQLVSVLEGEEVIEF